MRKGADLGGPKTWIRPEHWSVLGLRRQQKPLGRPPRPWEFHLHLHASFMTLCHTDQMAQAELPSCFKLRCIMAVK